MTINVELKILLYSTSAVPKVHHMRVGATRGGEEEGKLLPIHLTFFNENIIFFFFF